MTKEIKTKTKTKTISRSILKQLNTSLTEKDKTIEEKNKIIEELEKTLKDTLTSELLIVDADIADSEGTNNKDKIISEQDLKDYINGTIN